KPMAFAGLSARVASVSRIVSASSMSNTQNTSQYLSFFGMEEIYSLPIRISCPDIILDTVSHQTDRVSGNLLEPGKQFQGARLNVQSRGYNSNNNTTHLTCSSLFGEKSGKTFACFEGMWIEESVELDNKE